MADQTNIPRPVCAKCKDFVPIARVVEHDVRRQFVTVEVQCRGRIERFRLPELEIHNRPSATDIVFVEYQRVNE